MRWGQGGLLEEEIPEPSPKGCVWAHQVEKMERTSLVVGRCPGQRERAYKGRRACGRWQSK